MQNLTAERLVARIIAFGTAFTTIFIISGSVTDPVNVPKFMSLGVVSTSAIFLVFFTNQGRKLTKYKPLLVLVIFFIFFMTLAVIKSDSPLSQNIYGSYGRNNGFLTYLFLGFILIASLSITSISNFNLIIKALLFAGLTNVGYCLWVITFGDFIGWSNPYGNILGTFGNPNFIGSFLGIFFTCYLAYAIRPDSTRIQRYSLVMVLPITAFEIQKSHAVQGRVVAALGLAILGFLLVRAKYSRGIVLTYSAATIFGGILALLGTLQIGPLTDYIYKTSVSLRGQYWLAGWNTGIEHPITGVGMDAFGDWYRRSRDLHALELPGVNTVVNAAHNVPLDIFAFGGWPLFVTYLAILTFSMVAIVKLIRRRKDFDTTMAVLVIGWSGYQLQSIISINQIGLAVWGWLLSGALIAYEYATREALDKTDQQPSAQKKKVQNQVVQPKLVLLGSAGALMGLLVALPPLTADAKLINSQSTQTLPALEETMKSSYFNPQNSNKYLANIQTLEASSLFDISHKYALQAVKWNPEDFNLWKILYLIKNSTVEEKAEAVKNMNRLDPLNPDVTATK
jgi:hypothetical protein